MDVTWRDSARHVRTHENGIYFCVCSIVLYVYLDVDSALRSGSGAPDIVSFAERRLEARAHA